MRFTVRGIEGSWEVDDEGVWEAVFKAGDLADFPELIEEDGPNADGGFMEIWFDEDGKPGRPRWFRTRREGEEVNDAM